MMRAVARRELGWTFDLVSGGTAVAEIRTRMMRERGVLQAAGVEYVMSRKGWWKPEYRLEHGGVMDATAAQLSAFRRRWRICGAPHELELRCVSSWGRQFGVFAGGPQVGRIFRESWWRYHSVIDLPEWIPVPVQAFVFWVVMLNWRRAAQSS